MKAALRAVAALAVVASAAALAGEDSGSGRRAAPAEKPSWEFALTAYPTVVRGGENYTSAIAAADRGPLHLEAEYVRDGTERADSYAYAWSELGLRPVEWLRVGIAGQRTRAYGGDRELQRGPFAQATWGPVTIGGYWFNPGSNDQIFVGLVGAAF